MGFPFRFIHIFLLVAMGLPVHHASAAENIRQKVDAVFADYDKFDSPGCALGVIKNGEFIYKRGYGMANLEYRIPITSRSVFRIGSTSKQFTSMAIVLLDHLGKLSLDDDIRKFLPQMPQYQSPVTIRHMLHHTSGVRDYLTLMYLAGIRNDDYYEDDEAADIIARQKELNFKPGDQYAYSNSNYFLMSQVVEKITGKSLRQFAEENIFKPLGMTDSHFHNDPKEIVNNRASGYSRRDDGGFFIDMTSLEMIGDGGVFTTIDDLLKWDQNFYDNQLADGSQSLIDTMLTTAKLNDGEALDYGLGLVVDEYKGLKTVSHGGAFVGFRAEMIRFPEHRLSVACLCNLGDTNPSRLARQIADIYLADLLTIPEESPAVAEKPSQGIDLAESHLKNFVGAYHNSETGEIWEIALKEGRLNLQTVNRQYPLMALETRRFFGENPPVRLEINFERGENGEKLRAKVEGQSESVFSPVELVSLSQGQMEEFEGVYDSMELRASYRIHIVDGKLRITNENPYRESPEEPLEPTLKDQFRIGGLQFKFERDGAGKITGYRLDAGRVRNMLFESRSK